MFEFFLIENGARKYRLLPLSGFDNTGLPRDAHESSRPAEMILCSIAGYETNQALGNEPCRLLA
jgi:hypothetical protein